MTPMRPNGRIPAWTDRNCWRRVEACRAFLHMHGFLSDGEDRRVKDRIGKWLQGNGYRIVPRKFVRS